MRGRPPLRALDLGAAVVALLVPQRRPLCMVDRLVGLGADTLRACRFVSANDPVFDGHFPDVAVFPGALLLEGLAQTGGALVTLQALAEDSGMDALLDELANVERGATLHPGFDRPRADAFRQRLRARPTSIPLAGAAQVRFHRPVFPGCRVDYEVRLVKRLGDLVQLAFEAEVDDALVAEGSVSASRR